MHEMHSLLFAALETFSLILLRKKIPKNEESHFLITSCVSAGSAAHSVTVCSIFDQFYTNLGYLEYVFCFFIQVYKGFQLSSHHLPAYPGLKYRDILQDVVLNLLLFSIEGWLGRVLSHLFSQQRKERAQTSFIPKCLPLTSSGPMQLVHLYGLSEKP